MIHNEAITLVELAEKLDVDYAALSRAMNRGGLVDCTALRRQRPFCKEQPNANDQDRKIDKKVQIGS